MAFLIETCYSNNLYLTFIWNNAVLWFFKPLNFTWYLFIPYNGYSVLKKKNWTKLEIPEVKETFEPRNYFSLNAHCNAKTSPMEVHRTIPKR